MRTGMTVGDCAAPNASSAKRGEVAERAACPERFTRARPSSNAREDSCPCVAAAVEEAILVVVGSGFAVRLDDADLGECRFHRRTLIDGVEPAREIGVVLPLHALSIVVACPWEGGDVGDGILLPAEIGRLPEPRLQHLVEAFYFRRIAPH